MPKYIVNNLELIEHKTTIRATDPEVKKRNWWFNVAKKGKIKITSPEEYKKLTNSKEIF